MQLRRTLGSGGEGRAFSISQCKIVEVQSLVEAVSTSRSRLGHSQFIAYGIECSRVQWILAVLTNYFDVAFSDRNVYINVIPAEAADDTSGYSTDLAVAVALVSRQTSIPVRSDTAFVAEVGLLGESTRTRLHEPCG
jgi:DNA repair protein RadA/Sms